MTVLVVGASGATGSKLVEQLLLQNHNVIVIVRSPEKLPDVWKTNDNLRIITASVLHLSDVELKNRSICQTHCPQKVVFLYRHKEIKYPDVEIQPTFLRPLNHLMTDRSL